MFLNSVHEQCPNSDPKQCTVTKPGWVHSAHTQNPGRAHTACVVPMSWALLRAQQACRARSQRRSRACWVCTCRDTPRQPAPQDSTSLRCRDIKAARIMSRHHIGVVTPPRPLHVATSNRCRDIVSPAQSPSQVATSFF